MKCVDLFAGCGGLSLGFQQAGFQIVVAYDKWEPAIEVYKENFSHPICKLDLTNEANAITEIKRWNPDIIIAGPPCQDFSSAGKRDISLGRADLTYHYANIICSLRPSWFVMENVEQIKKSHILTDVIEQYITEGYGLSAVILDASYCGVPQARTRFFLIGHLGDKHNRLKEIFRTKLSPKPMTIRDYLGNSLKVNYYYRHPRNYTRRGVFSIDEPSPTVRGVNRPVPPGYTLNNCDSKGVKLEDVRPLTTIERSYIQTFPKSFKWTGGKTNLEQMIGNAVPVELAYYVAEVINIYCKNGEIKPDTLFDLNENFILPNKALHRTEK